MGEVRFWMVVIENLDVKNNTCSSVEILSQTNQELIGCHCGLGKSLFCKSSHTRIEFRIVNVNDTWRLNAGFSAPVED